MLEKLTIQVPKALFLCGVQLQEVHFSEKRDFVIKFLVELLQEVQIVIFLIREEVCLVLMVVRLRGKRLADPQFLAFRGFILPFSLVKPHHCAREV